MYWHTVLSFSGSTSISAKCFAVFFAVYFMPYSLSGSSSICRSEQTSRSAEQVQVQISIGAAGDRRGVQRAGHSSCWLCHQLRHPHSLQGTPGLALCVAGLFDDFISLIWFEWILWSVCPHRTTSIEWDEQPEQGGLGNPSLLSLSKNCLFLCWKIILASLLTRFKINFKRRCVLVCHRFSNVNVEGGKKSEVVDCNQTDIFCYLRYDVELFQRIETLIGKKLPAFPTQEDEVMMLVERVSEAQRFARMVSHHFSECFPDTISNMENHVVVCKTGRVNIIAYSTSVYLIL